MINRIAYLIFIFSPLSAIAQDTLKPFEIVTQGILTPSTTYINDQISDSLIDESGHSNLTRLLQTHSSCYIKSQGPGDLASISIRGAGASHTKVYWNGIPINSPTLGQINLSMINLSSAESISIQQGASSVINGSGGLGGALAMSNTQKEEQVKSTIEMGSFGILNHELTFAKQIGERIQSQTRINRRSANNNFKYKDVAQKDHPIEERVHAGFEQEAITQSIFFNPEDHFNVSIHANQTSNSNEMSSALGSSDGYQTLNNLNQKVAIAAHLQDSNSLHTIQAGIMHDHLQYEDSTAQINSDISSERQFVRYQFDHDYSDKIHFKVQLNGLNDRANSSGFTEIKTQKKQSAFLQFEHTPWKNFNYHLAIRSEVIDQTFVPVIPSLGLRISLPRRHFIAINLNKNFSAPSLNDLYWSPGGNPDLKPESGESAEFNYGFNKGKLNIEVSNFYSRIDNWIQWIPNSSGVWSPQNFKEVQRFGSNTQASSNFTLGRIKTTAFLKYAFVSAKTTSTEFEADESLNKQLIYVPLHNLSSGLNFQWTTWNLDYNHSFTSKTFINASNTTYLPYYAPANIALSKRLEFSSDLIGKCGINVFNIYNEDYQIMANRPIPRRYFTILFSLTWK